MKIFKQSQNYPLLMKLQTQLNIGRQVSPDGTSSEVIEEIWWMPPFPLYFLYRKRLKWPNVVPSKRPKCSFQKCLEDFWCNAQIHGKILIGRQNSHISRLRENKCTQQNFEKSCSTVQKVACRWCCSSLGHWWFNRNN